MTRALALTLALLAPAARAQTAVVRVSADGPVGSEAVEAVLWHALYDRHGHEARFLGAAEDLLGALDAAELGEAYAVEVRWRPHAQPLDGHGTVAPLSPRVEVRRLALGPEGLVEVERWATWGRARPLLQVDARGREVPVSVPVLALQDAVDRVVARVRPPIWTGEVPEPIAVPVEIVADEEFRARYGPGWAARADLRVERASALLRAAGLRLDVRWHGAWRSSAEAADLSALLDDLAGAPRRDPSAIRVAFTGQVGPELDDPLQDVGRAYLPGRDLVVADQPPVPGQSARWDEAEEATILAHEVLHALGAPHLEAGHYVMSSPKSGTSHALAASTRALARSAAEARFATRDDVAAATLLGEAAAAWIEDRATQVAYVGGNLSLGPGVPDPERIPHLRTSALVSQALAAGLDP